MKNAQDNKALIYQLKQIKRAIWLGAGGGVSDTAWMVGPGGEASDETICDRIDYLLTQLGVSVDELDADFEAMFKKDAEEQDDTAAFEKWLDENIDSVTRAFEEKLAYMEDSLEARYNFREHGFEGFAYEMFEKAGGKL